MGTEYYLGKEITHMPDKKPAKPGSKPSNSAKDNKNSSSKKPAAKKPKM